MAADVAVITCITDGYDTLKPICPQNGTLTVDWICVTDGTGPPPFPGSGWRIVKEPRHHEHPNRAAKWPKCMPWQYTDAPASIWVDASFRVASRNFVADAMARAEPIAQFRHPWRDCLYDEAGASALLGKYGDEPVLEQAAHYQKIGFPKNWGLWASGVIARRHTEEVKDFGRLWLSEIGRWSFQDQVSEPFALNIAGLRPADLPGWHLENPWLSYEGSARH